MCDPLTSIVCCVPHYVDMTDDMSMLFHVCLNCQSKSTKWTENNAIVYLNLGKLTIALKEAYNFTCTTLK